MSKKKPLRMCLACRQMQAKSELIRLTVDKEKRILLDLTGKMSGRGAYICKKYKCLQAALHGKYLQRNLKGILDPETEMQLQNLVEKDSHE